MQFEFHQFDENVDPICVSLGDYRSDAAALSHAGTLAKKNNGPVDLARVNGEVWSDRYMTTASPSEFHAKGYRFERLG